ncbi:imidazole glycerol phosphate synthase subunit HisH [Nitratifractor salsuginis]|uniref:Imidazole glycerol phosphate synthase subunit HisH n=1 Tax=Nitratifractor salsuginis (strain DSM 16511 / JCM 12458 / E9I37-1) TaxID=749222 RepID=E6X169_NITSE|nr:imidazole glycerol phosphate synthase subunit HisH [Nitratifractor salsuginis]ADV46931.1 imidazole glycerol phosphate synthase subunit hisH [Nitratifractor salsuginis DSM 16511]
MIGVIDYKMGNLGSVLNAFAKVGARAELVSDPKHLKKYDRIQLPGVGAFPDAMEHLRSTGMDEAIREFARSGKPLMGTCLGMQLLFEESEEFGKHQGLGLIPGRVVRFDESKFDHTLKVPHMGWNELFVQRTKGGEDKRWKSEDGRSTLFEGLPDEFYLYFVHSYHAVCDDEYAIGKTYYGYEFVSAVQRENIFGIQPHPEKSHDNGLKIVKNFTKL